ncbi:MAG: hypothetical protein J0I45_21815 [Bosea sp.]|nr:hypothetical protein [Bosea sp. (in: a-proteobacteria)]
MDEAAALRKRVETLEAMVKAIRLDVDMHEGDIDRLDEAALRLSEELAETSERSLNDSEEAFERLRLSDHAMAALALAFAKTLADIAGWSDDDITRFLLRRSDEAQASAGEIAPEEDPTMAHLVRAYRDCAARLQPHAVLVEDGS